MVFSTRGLDTGDGVKRQTKSRLNLSNYPKSHPGDETAKLGQKHSFRIRAGFATTLLDAALGNGRVRISGGVLIALILAAFLAPMLPFYDPFTMNANMMFGTPTQIHWLGNDEFGRDILSRILLGAQVSLRVAALSTLLASTVGVTLGMISAYYGGLLDMVIMRSMDVLLSFPAILLGIAVVAFLGNSVTNLMIVIAVVYTPRFARVAYGVGKSVSGNEYVTAARSIGATDGRILFRAILPNMLAPMIVQFSLTLGFAVLVESSLSFIGLGTMPPTPSWGNMIAAASHYLDRSPVTVLWPSLAVGSVIFLFNTLGDGLRDALDPRLQKTGM